MDSSLTSGICVVVPVVIWSSLKGGLQELLQAFTAWKLINAICSAVCNGRIILVESLINLMESPAGSPAMIVGDVPWAKQMQ